MAQNKAGFSEAEWNKIIQKPDWYFDYLELIKNAKSEFGENSNGLIDLTKNVRHFFEKALLAGKVNLASHGPNLDLEREPIDTVVIHHTSAEPGYRLSYMNAVQLLNIYAPYYAKPTVREEKKLKGTAMWSGHFLDGKPSFIGYHWLMRMDGTFERLLQDNELGWHAGNWEINKRSVAICLDNDYENQDPAPEVLQNLARHIKKHYSFIEPRQIIGHQEARVGTICPGSNFKKLWKRDLLDLLD